NFGDANLADELIADFDDMHLLLGHRGPSAFDVEEEPVWVRKSLGVKFEIGRNFNRHASHLAQRPIADRSNFTELRRLRGSSEDRSYTNSGQRKYAQEMDPSRSTKRLLANRMS